MGTMSIMVGPMSLAALREMCPEGTEIRMGDTRLIWSSDAPAEVDAMRATFDKLTGKGYKAFRVDDKGEKGERIATFDPSARKMILIPVIAGGNHA